MKLVFALFIISCISYCSAFFLPLQEQVALDALKQAIPSLQSKWTSFTDLDVTNCATTFPGLTCSSTNVVTLDFTALNLCCSGTIPSEVGFLTSLTTLTMPGIGLTGSIPLSVFGLASLTTINLQNNKLSGSLENIIYTPNLITFNVHNNSLTGTIPAVTATNLVTFNVQLNSLNSTIPDWLGNPAYSALSTSTTAIGGSSVGTNLFSGCAPRLRRLSSGGCGYFSDNATSCFCPGECTNGDGTGNCKCPTSGNIGLPSACSPSVTAYTGAGGDIIGIGNSLAFRCGSVLCIYDKSTSITVTTTTTVTNLYYFGGNVYYSNPTSFGNIVLPGGSPNVLVSTSSTLAVYQVNAGFYVVENLATVYPVTGISPTPTAVPGLTFLTSAYAGGIFNGNSAIFGTDSSVSNGGTTSFSLSSLSLDSVSNFVAGSNGYYFIGKNPTTTFLYYVAYSSPTTATVLSSSPAPDDTIPPVVFGSNVYYVSKTSPALIKCGLTSCTTSTSVHSSFSASSPVFVIAQNTLFFSNGSMILYIDSTSTSATDLISYTPDTLTDFAVLDSQLFAVIGSTLQVYFATPQLLTPSFNSLASVSSLQTTSNILTPGDSATTVAFFASNTLQIYKNMYSACDFPNTCEFTNKATCTPNLLTSFTCGTTSPACTNGVLVSNECVPSNLCATNNGGCAVGLACNASTGSVVCQDVNQCTTGANNCINRTCVNNPTGLYTCNTDCPSGYTVDGSYRCKDVNECTTNTSSCSGNATCANTAGSFNCTCNTNYTGNAFAANGCYLINPCSTLNPCATQADCANTGLGQFTCTCKPGYNGTGFTCTDINECTDGTDNCSANANCTNTAGSFSCTCLTGYSGNGTTCSDINECTNATLNTCSGNATCANTNGSFTCTCNSGYSGTGFTCADINECTNSTLNTCSPNATCTNTAGSFNCTCNSGYSGTGFVCSDINECTGTNNCSSNATCTNTNGSFTCACNSGYSGNGVTCADINECTNATLNTCSPNATCTNTNGNFTCACNSGYSGNGFSCADINECTNATLNTCSPNATCTNTNGNFTCACNSGYSGNGFSCTDINECTNATLNTCSPNAICTNTNGSFTCACRNGYTGTGFVCSDVNECLNPALHNCSADATCLNTNGSFTCTCNSGFTGNGVTCNDVNECSNATICGINAFCTNFAGGYNCTCNVNFSGNANLICYDDAPCRVVPCDVNAACAATGTGGFVCTCNNGWTGNGTKPSACSDIDECSNSSTCVANAYCTNSAGSFACTCNSTEGYTGDGRVACYLSDPCTSLPFSCDGNATCNNTGNGQYDCTCKNGFTGNAGEAGGCYYSDPCVSLTPCGSNSVCNNTGNGGYNCGCVSGYIRNATTSTCDDINECDSTPCPNNTVCTNTAGSFSCACQSGYSGNSTPGEAGCDPIDACAVYGVRTLCGADSNCTVTGPNTTSCTCLTGFSKVAGGTTCECVASGNSACALAATGQVSVTGNYATSGATTIKATQTEVPAGGVLNLTRSSAVTFQGVLKITGGVVDARGTVLTVTGGIDVSSSGSLLVNEGSTLVINNCDRTTTISGPITVTSPPTDASKTIEFSIETPNAGPNCRLQVPANLVSASGCSAFSSAPTTNPAGLTFSAPCGIVQPPTPTPTDLTWLWAVIAVVAVIVIILIILFAVPSIRRKILGSCSSDDFEESDSEELKPQGKPPQRPTSEGSRQGKPIPNPPFNVTAIADYMAVDTSQISVTKGVIYTVQRVDEGQHWFQAKGANGKLGWFPASYARIES